MSYRMTAQRLGSFSTTQVMANAVIINGLGYPQTRYVARNLGSSIRFTAVIAAERSLRPCLSLSFSRCMAFVLGMLSIQFSKNYTGITACGFFL